MEDSTKKLLIQSTTELLPVFDKILKLIDTTQKNSLQETMKIGENELKEYIYKRIQEAIANEKKTESLYEEINDSIVDSLDLMLRYLESADLFSIPIEHFDVINSQLKNMDSMIMVCGKYGYEIKIPKPIIQKSTNVITKYDNKNHPQGQRISEGLKKIVDHQMKRESLIE